MIVKTLNNMKETEFYKQPLKLMYSKVFTQDNKMAFDFAHKFLFPNGFFLSDENKEQIVKILNDEIPDRPKKLNLSYTNGIIYHTDETHNKREFIIIRGWGGLTGVGGKHLDPDEACKIQNDFAEAIINKLQNQ